MVWVNQHPKGEEQLFYEYIAATSWQAGYAASAKQLYSKEEIRNLIHEELKEADLLGKDNERFYTILGVVMSALERNK